MTAPETIRDFLPRLADGGTLDEAEAERAFGLLMAGDATPAQAGAFLMALRVRGETVAEITGAARVMRARALAVDAPAGAIDTCGTGGDGAGSFNVSTAAALVVAACGVPVAKHGNRAVSSRSGSADVLAALGLDIDAPLDLVVSGLRDFGFGFLMAPRHHAATRNVMPVRTELGVRTVFNLLGPLSNPALAKRQVLGVFDRKWVEPLAKVLDRLGSERAWVIHGADGLDELTLSGPSHVASLDRGRITLFEVTPEDAGLRRRKGSVKGGSPRQNATTMKKLLRGETGAIRDIVLLNAAAALVVAGKAETLRDGAALAAEAIDSGAAARNLARLVERTTGRDRARGAS